MNSNKMADQNIEMTTRQVDLDSQTDSHQTEPLLQDTSGERSNKARERSHDARQRSTSASGNGSETDNFDRTSFLSNAESDRSVTASDVTASISDVSNSTGQWPYLERNILMRCSEDPSKKAPTNAYGEIEFDVNKSNRAKYVRVADDTNIDSILKVLRSDWEMKMPNLVISITGSARNINMRASLTEAFRRGLIKAAVDTEAWIVTNGADFGVTKCVGEAVRDCGLNSQKQVHAIGITSWNLLDNKECLTDMKEFPTGLWPARYGTVQRDKLQRDNVQRDNVRRDNVQRDTVQRDTVQRDTVQRDTVQRDNVQRDTVQRDTVQRDSVQRDNVQRGTVQRDTVQRDNVQRDTVQRDTVQRDQRMLYLDSHHTHFLLVDGMNEEDGADILFRARFEKKMRDQESVRVGERESVLVGERETVSVCLLVLGGGISSLLTVKRALKDCTPTVVIKGSGRTADILSYACQNAKIQISLETEVRHSIEEMIKESFGTFERKYFNWVLECIEMSKYLSVFELDSHNTSKDVDVAILTALLKADKNQKIQQLKLAITWNRIDIARSEVLTDDAKWTAGQLNDVLLLAIELNRVDFVKLLLELDINLGDFLTKDRLLHLYRSAKHTYPLNKVLREAKVDVDNFQVEDISRVIQTLIQLPYKSIYTETPERCVSAEDELFTWATLVDYHELSIIFWAKNKESSIERALFAQNILISMKKRTEDSLLCFPDSHLSRKFQAAIDNYGEIATHLINDFYTFNETWTHSLLERETKPWGDTSILNLAIQAENTTFIAQYPCQSYFKSAWFGHIRADASMFLLFICSIFFPLIPCLSRFLLKSNESSLSSVGPILKSNESSQRSGGPVSCSQHIWNFYKSPIVKFCMNVYSYVAFLFSFSAILLLKLSDKFFWLEALVIVWVFTYFIEEVRQCFTVHNSHFMSKIKRYLKNEWNVLDLVNVSLFSLGYGLRFHPSLLDAARVILGMSFITFSIRALHIFSVDKQWGVLLSAINKMMVDLIRFVIILFVFIVSYAVASEAILYPEAKLSWKMVYRLPRKAYWQIYGELFLDDIEGDTECTHNPELYNNGTLLRCPSKIGQYLAPILLGVYILVTNVMLLNILIAILSNTLQRIQNNVNMYWNLQLLDIVSEYVERPALPPPLNLLTYLYSLLNRACDSPSNQRGPAKHGKGPFCERYIQEENELRMERFIVCNYLDSQEKVEHDHLHDEMKTIKDQLEKLLLKVEDRQSERKETKVDSRGNIPVPARRENSTLDLRDEILSENLREEINFATQSRETRRNPY